MVGWSILTMLGIILRIHQQDMITLVSADDSILEINCVWSDRSRDKTGRVTLAKK